MTEQMSVGKALGIAAITFVLAASAHADQRPVAAHGALRTFVSGLGNDSNTATQCPRANPCRTLAAAYTVTATGGEITALDPADYGPLTITGQLSIFGTNDALIGVAGGTTGITINAPAAARVIVRNFIISGAGATNTKGIVLNTGQLALFNSTLEQLSVGLSVSSTKADLVNTDLIANATGITTTGTGVDTNVFPMTGPTQVRVAWGNTIGNAKAYVMNNPGTGTGGNKITILEFLSSNTDAAYSTNMTANGNLVSGTGSSCSGTNCQSLGYYSSYTNPE
jgi:hypothetical protein